MSLSQTVNEIRQQQAQATPEAQARARLAPPRAALITDMKTVQKAQPKLAQRFGAARVAQQEAASIGVSLAELDHLLSDVYGHEGASGLLDSIVLRYGAAIDKIDHLTEQDLNFMGCEQHLADQPRILRETNGLEVLAKEAERLTRELEKAVEEKKKAVASPPPLMTTGSPPGQPTFTGLRVDSDFEL